MYEANEQELHRNVGKARSLLQRINNRSGFLLVLRCLGWWLVSLLVLYILLGWRPQPPYSWPDNTDAWSNLHDYAGRLAGTIPQQCALTESSAKLPEPLSDAGERKQAWATNAPVMIQLLERLEVESGSGDGGGPCMWRRTITGMLVAFSIDVGFIQKITLLGLVIGLVLVKRQRIQLAVDELAFPERETSPSDGASAEFLERRLEHPARLVFRRRDRPLALYPNRELPLEAEAAGSSTQEYKSDVENISEHIEAASRGGSTAPFDLIVDVVDSGAATGSVGAADERMRGAVEDYRSRLQEGFWPIDYILWLLPTIGFLGTIYGISVGLVKAKGIFNKGDGDIDFQTSIGQVVDGLGQAFDTTSMALICAAILFLSLKRAEARTIGTADRAKRTMANLLIARMRDRPDVGILRDPGES